MSVLQSLRAGVLCGITPCRLEAAPAAGRPTVSVAWRGDRAGALAFAQDAERLPPGSRLILVYRAFVWDKQGKRTRVEREMDFAAPLADLLREEQARQSRRDESSQPRVRWRPGAVSTTEPAPRRAASMPTHIEAPP